MKLIEKKKTKKKTLHLQNGYDEWLCDHLHLCVVILQLLQNPDFTSFQIRIFKILILKQFYFNQIIS